LEILEGYAKKDLRIRIFNQENKGPGPARNVALDNVRGKYILFCDADDTLEPDACRQCCEIMENNQVDIIVFNTQIIEDGRIDTLKQNSSGQYIYCVKSNNAGLLNKIGCLKVSVITSVLGYCFRADLIRRHKLYFKHYWAAEDSIFLYSYLMLIRKGYAVDKIFYNYYVHKGSLIDKAKEKIWRVKKIVYLCILLYETFLFALKNKMPFQEIYIFYWLFIWLKARR
jgi:glycosyltransferase involved in cell wall biosynthesis